MKTQRILSIAIIGLLVINMAMVSGFWISQHQHRPGNGHFPPPPPPEHGGAFLDMALALSDSQKLALKSIRRTHFEKTKDMHNQLQEKRTALQDLMKGNDDNINKAGAIADEIGQLHAQLELLTFEHFREIRAICNKEQKEKFDSIIREVLMKMGPGRMPPPPGAPHPEPPILN